MALTSIQHPDAKVSVHFRHGDVEVMVVEVGPGSALLESTLWSGSSWHLVIDGQAIFQQGERDWEVLPDDSLLLDADVPYTIRNASRERLRLLSVVVTASEHAEKEQLV